LEAFVRPTSERRRDRSARFPGRTALLAVAAYAVLTFSAAADGCRAEAFDGADYTICSFDPATADLRIFWERADGIPYRTFSALAAELTDDGEALGFAINGGMYDEDLAPVGLLTIAGKELHPVNRKDAPRRQRPVPNFYKKPNGVFFLAGGRAGILDTDAFLEKPPEADFATQSGPMLLIGGRVHPAFIAGSTDRKRRDGVGVSATGEIHFAISEDEVNFHNFALLFRDRLDCADALFLDGGSAPGIYAPELGRDDPPGHGGYGPIIAVVGK
jgi:uncharacterized protein YigE (DUF2233 family)